MGLVLSVISKWGRNKILNGEKSHPIIIVSKGRVLGSFTSRKQDSWILFKIYSIYIYIQYIQYIYSIYGYILMNI